MFSATILKATLRAEGLVKIDFTRAGLFTQFDMFLMAILVQLKTWEHYKP